MEVGALGMRLRSSKDLDLRGTARKPGAGGVAQGRGHRAVGLRGGKQQRQEHIVAYLSFVVYESRGAALL